MDTKTDMLRHTLATLAYRGNRALDGAAPEFGAFAGAGRTPGQILAHIGDLLDWALSIANGAQRWREVPPGVWSEDVARFFAGLEALDKRLASGPLAEGEPEKLFQGPVADALTHVGQIAMLRRLAGCPQHGENYYVADIAAGRVGPSQAAPKRTF
ncbi:MAG TPA: hypothetical protein VMU19_02910 [Bryobacteraceae bacterium]|nr:hypothetical protein [Bryobacteraceae bacterium]